ncbi:MAG TPA: hypothetical protein ENK21_10300 [Trueperaceae bacterium]|nr:hypothetical protein [Trueperaceae bacterium]
MFHQAELIVLENSEANKLLTNFDSIHLLQPFFLKPRSLKEVSDEYKIPMSSYFYWIKKFLNFGLLVISEEKKRAGSSIKYYITPAKKILLKIDKDNSFMKKYYDSYSNKYDMNHKLTEQLMNSIKNRSKDLAILLRYTEQNNFHTNAVLLAGNETLNITFEMLEPEEPAFVGIWRDMRLSATDAKELQQRMVNLIYEYDKKVSPDGERLLIQTALVTVT